MWTREQLQIAVSDSKSYAETLRNLGIAVSGGTHIVIKKYITKYGINTTHFSQIGTRRIKARLITKDVLVMNSTVSSSTLRRIIVRDGILPRICVECGVENQYNGKPITLHLDHKSGDRKDCRIENLRWLCPNCHSQTSTYSRAKTLPIQLEARKKKAERVQIPCSECKITITRLKSKVEYQKKFWSSNFFCSKKCKITFWHKKNGWSKSGEHGTVAGYHKCPKPRCRPCLDAMAVYKRSRRNH